MSIVDVDGNDASDEMTLRFRHTLSAPEKPVGPDYVDVYTVTETDYTVRQLEGAKAYVWELWPEDAGSIYANDTTATVSWNTSYLGEASLKVSAVNDCGMGLFSDSLNIFVDNTVGAFDREEEVALMLAPNPNNGNFKLIFKTQDKSAVQIKLYNYLGVEVMHITEGNIAGGFTRYFVENNLQSGVYVLVVEQRGKRYSRKMLIQK
jgi:hypothetical protein